MDLQMHTGYDVDLRLSVCILGEEAVPLQEATEAAVAMAEVVMEATLRYRMGVEDTGALAVEDTDRVLMAEAHMGAEVHMDRRQA